MEQLPTPSEALAHYLRKNDITAYELAKKTLLPSSRISEILSAKRRITAETATILGDFFGTTTEYWLQIQTNYDVVKSEASDADSWIDDGELAIGGFAIWCYITPDERRLVALDGFLRLVGFHPKTGRQRIDELLDSPYLQGSKIKSIREQLKNPIRLLGANGKVIFAVPGELVIEYCQAVLEIRRIGGITESAKSYLDKAEIVVTSVAKVGITALIDEATGYQVKRHKAALQNLLDRYFREDIAAWSKKFPDWFYEEIFRLKGWQWKNLSSKRPGWVGSATKDIVYERIEVGVIEELERLNPMQNNGSRKSRHHQWLTDDVGHPALNNHFYALKGLMRASPDWDRFYHTLQLAYPKKNEAVQLQLTDLPEPV